MNSFLEKLLPEFMSVPRKTHHLGNYYHSIADGDEGNPVMYRIKIQKWKDRPKDANGKWDFTSKYEGENPNMGRKYTKNSSFMCEMEVPIHGTGKLFQGTVDLV